MDDFFGVVVIFGEDQSLWQPFAGAFWKQLGKDAVLIGLQHGPDLVRVHDGFIQFLGGVFQIGIQGFVAHFARTLVTDRHLESGIVGLDLAALLCHTGTNPINLVADVDAIGDGTLVRVFGNQVLIEKTQRVLGRRRGQADDRRVEIFQHLPPKAIDRPMTFIGDDEIKGLNRNVGIVGKRQRLAILGLPFLEAGLLFVFIVDLLAAQHGIQPLDRGDDDLGVGINPMRVQLLHNIRIGKTIAGAGRLKCLKLAQGLIAQVVAVDQEQDATRTGVLDKSVAERTRGKRLARPRRHLDQRAGLVTSERFFKIRNGLGLTVAKAARIQGRHMC